MLGTALMATIALMGGGQAEPFCRPPPKQSRIGRYQEDRRLFGFRSDRAYVRRLIRRGARRYEGFGFPITRRERRYLRRRETLDLGGAARRYLHRRPDLSGGISVEDDYPRGAYLLVRLTRDRARHTGALRRLVPRPRHLRTRKVPVSERDLIQLQNRIDWDAADAAGYFVVTSSPDIDASTVDLDVITAQPGAQQYFRERYGPRVRVTVIATELTSPECTTVEGYRADGSTLTIRYESGGGATFDHVEVTEHPDRVEIGVIVQAPNGPRTADSLIREHTITLAAPLGTRRVVDASTGKTVRPGGGR